LHAIVPTKVIETLAALLWITKYRRRLIGTRRCEGRLFNTFANESGSIRRRAMGRYLLLWVIGVPIPILLLIWAFGGLH
jgi:hypothetical protein